MNRLAICIALSLLAACGTPQPALDQANHGAALIASLQGEMRNLRRAEAAVANVRMDSIRQQRTLIAIYETDAAFDDRIQAAAGKSAEAQLVVTLRRLADSRTNDEKDLQARATALDASMAGLLSPVPDQGPKLDAAQQAVGTLGLELSFQERLRLVGDFASEVNDAVAKNRKAIKAAETGVPVVAPQAASASAPAGVAPK